MFIILGGTLHKCDICEETFTKQFSLEQHLIKHRKELYELRRFSKAFI